MKTNSFKLYIEPIEKSEMRDGTVSETYLPSSALTANPQITPEMLSGLKTQLIQFVNAFANDSLSGWKIDKIELGISFSTEAKAWVINVGGNGSVKITLTPDGNA